MNAQICQMTPNDFSQVAAIYSDGIKTGLATFQPVVPTWREWDESHIKTSRLIIKSDNNNILGWAALTPFSKMQAYSGVAEVSIYISQEHKRKGLGRKLLLAIIEDSEKNSFWTLQAKIIKENTASIILHKTCGFRKVGIGEKLGKMLNGNWHDVVFMERRSSIV